MLLDSASLSFSIERNLTIKNSPVESSRGKRGGTACDRKNFNLLRTID
ncbi:hypothetical protein QUB57_08090 [Microcoleus sp. F6_C1]